MIVPYAFTFRSRGFGFRLVRLHGFLGNYFRVSPVMGCVDDCVDLKELSFSDIFAVCGNEPLMDAELR